MSFSQSADIYTKQRTTYTCVLRRFVWPIGFIVSVIPVGRIFNAQSAKNKTRLVLLMTCTSTIAIFVIGWMVSSLDRHADSNEVPPVSFRIATICLVFVVAVGVGLPYYVPSGEFSVRFGGDQAGVVCAYLDGASALATGIFLRFLSTLVRSVF